MTSKTKKKVVRIPLRVAYQLIINWAYDEDLKIRRVDPHNSIIVNFKYWMGPIKTKKVFFYLRQIDQFAIQISTKVSMSGGLAFKGMLNQVFRKSSLFNLLSYLDIIDQNLEEISNVKTLTEKEHFFNNDPQAVLRYRKEEVQWGAAKNTSQPSQTQWESAKMTSQPSLPQSQTQQSPPQHNYQQRTYQQSTNPQENEYNRLLEKKATFLKFIQEAEETDLSFASEEKKENVQRTIALYNHKIKEIDIKLEAFSK